MWRSLGPHTFRRKTTESEPRSRVSLGKFGSGAWRARQRSLVRRRLHREPCFGGAKGFEGFSRFLTRRSTWKHIAVSAPRMLRGAPNTSCGKDPAWFLCHAFARCVSLFRFEDDVMMLPLLCAGPRMMCHGCAVWSVPGLHPSKPLHPLPTHPAAGSLCVFTRKLSAPPKPLCRRCNGYTRHGANTGAVLTSL